MADSSQSTPNLADGGVVELTGKIMVVSIILLLFVIVFIFCLHLYAKWYLYHRRDSANAATTGRRRRRRRLDFANGDRTVMSVRQGLDSSILKTLPIVVFDPKEFEEGLECAVCLSEVCDGEKARLLPKCNHGFHVECIDMWFESHSTCPLCRNAVSCPKTDGDGEETTLEVIVEGEDNTSFPTNVLFWGNESGEPSSSSGSRPDGALVIDVPVRREVNVEEEVKSPSPSPIPSRFKSLKRLLSGNSRRLNVNVIGEPSTSLAIDVPREMSEEEVKSPLPSSSPIGSRFKSLKRLLSGNSRRVNVNVNPSSPRNGVGEPSSSNGVLVIDVAREVNEDEVKSPLPSSRFKTPKRILSGNLPSPRSLDIEQGGRGQS